MTPSYPARLVLCLALFTVALGACAPRVAEPGPGLEVLGIPDGLRDEFLVTEDGVLLPLRVWRPEGEPSGVILALHGFNDYSKAFEGPAQTWAAAGLVTYAYDQRGFGAAPQRGLWAGSAAMTGDLGTAARALRARHPDLPLFLLGNSMGGAVILAALGGGDPPPGDGIILVAPAVWARAAMPWYQRSALWLAAHTVPWAKPSGRGLAIRASDNDEMLRGLGRDPMVIKRTRIDTVYGLVNLMDEALAAAPAVDRPTLLLYGEKDEIVPKDPTFRLWRDLPAETDGLHRRALYAEGWHMLLRDLQAEVVLRDIVAWTRDRHAPLPSSADARAMAALSDCDC